MLCVGSQFSEKSIQAPVTFCSLTSFAHCDRGVVLLSFSGALVTCEMVCDVCRAVSRRQLLSSSLFFAPAHCNTRCCKDTWKTRVLGAFGHRLSDRPKVDSNTRSRRGKDKEKSRHSDLLGHELSRQDQRRRALPMCFNMEGGCTRGPPARFKGWGRLCSNALSG